MVKPSQRSYPYPRERVMDAALRGIAELRYRMNSVDRESGLISFRTGVTFRSWGQDMSLTVVGNGPNECSVAVGAKVGFALLDWGERKSITAKIFNLVEEYLQVETPTPK